MQSCKASSQNIPIYHQNLQLYKTHGEEVIVKLLPDMCLGMYETVRS